jgi:hypothetical protein
MLYRLCAEGFWRCNILIGMPEIVVVTVFRKLDMPFTWNGQKGDPTFGPGIETNTFYGARQIMFFLFHISPEEGSRYSFRDVVGFLALDGEQCPEFQSRL